MYSQGKKVVVKSTDGVYRDGTLLDRVDFGKETMWWVQVDKQGSFDVQVFSVESLDEWNKSPIESICVCGSKAAGVSNRHAFYCEAK